MAMLNNQRVQQKDTERWFPQTWLAGKSPQNRGFSSVATSSTCHNWGPQRNTPWSGPW